MRAGRAAGALGKSLLSVDSPMYRAPQGICLITCQAQEADSDQDKGMRVCVSSLPLGLAISSTLKRPYGVSALGPAERTLIMVS